MYRLFLVFGLFISEINCGYYFVTAPNIIRFDNDETILVSVFGLKNAAVKIWLQHGAKRISEKHVVVANENTPRATTVKVTKNDLFDTVVEEKPRYIRIFSEWNGQTHSREVILSYKTGYLIVQMDKPIYTPLQNVIIRTLALDESLKRVYGWQVAIDIIDPSNRTLARKTTTTSASGFFEHLFKLPPDPEIGMWTARAFYKGLLETEARSSFEVQEYVLPTFGVEIDVDVPCILPDTASIQVTVRAKYVYVKPVDGHARLTLNLKNKDDRLGYKEYLFDMNKKSLEIDGDNEGSVTEFSIDVADILNSSSLRGKDFPNGRRLEIVATVYESATGKEEATSHERTIFATEPFIFKFTKSKLNFRPGLKYFLKVEMLNINGQPAAGENIEVKMYKDGVFNYLVTRTTDKNGHVESIFHTSWHTYMIEFTVTTLNKRQTSEKFRVEAYLGKSQIQVEHIIADNKTMFVRAYTNMYSVSYTGMFFMVVTRGKIVYTMFKAAANEATLEIIEELQEVVSPDARLIVFCVDNRTHELVADSVKLDVENKCRGRGLNLGTDKVEVMPGSRNKLTVTGSPYMLVGLNVMDKALLLLNNKNVIRKNKMFEALQSRDLGCGVGGGHTSADVFKKSGLTVLTNAKVDVDDLVRDTDGCGKKIKKRDTGPCYQNSDIRCSEQGSEFDTKSPDKCVDCYTQAINLTRDKRSENTHVKKRSLDDEYEMDKIKLEDAGVIQRSRTDFSESWLFQLVQLDKNGQATVFIDFPDSITEWMIQGIGITPDKGICIAEDIDVKAFKDFFIQLGLPYNAVRLENIDVKAAIFNYGNSVIDNKTVNIYFEGTEHLCYGGIPGKPSPKVSLVLPPNSVKTVSFPVIPLRKGMFWVTVTAFDTESYIPGMDSIEKAIYVLNEGVEEKIAIHVCLDPLNQQDDCKNDYRVITDVRHGGERVYKIDLTLPGGSIPQTGSGTAYIQSNLMTNVVSTIIEGIDSLLQLPYGNVEDTLAILAPMVYAMSYLKQTKQVTMDIEMKGEQWIRDGSDRVVTQYRHPDGSYSAWQSRASSTWLTSFVAKVFCQADKAVGDAIDEHDIKVTIDWLINHVKNDGSFVDNFPVLYRYMIGQIDARGPSLTAFVLISFEECEIRSNVVQDIIVKASKFLEDIPETALRNNPYLLAISTYALALVNSPEKYRFKNLLQQIQTKDGDYLYWGNPAGKPASAQSVETTAYALLAMLKFNDFKNSAFIVRWLTSQRYTSRLFRTTQETVVSLQALTQYSIATNSAELDLKVTLLSDDWIWEEFYLTKENAVVQQVVRKLPVEHRNHELLLKVSGSGSGIMTIDLRYNRPASEEESCPFEISDVEVEDIDDAPIYVNLAKERNCDVCGRCAFDPEEPDEYDIDMFDAPVEANPKIESDFGRRKRQAIRGMRATKTETCIRLRVSSKTDKVNWKSVVRFELGKGVKIVQSDLEKLMEDNPNIERYEMLSIGYGFVIFYLDKVTSQENEFIFRLKDEFEGDLDSRQPSSVKVYDYYNPARQCTKFYETVPNGGQGIDFECDIDQRRCSCLQNMCVKPVEDEIRRMVRRKSKPATSLYRYTCDLEKANYAVLVEIETLDYNHQTNLRTARAIVLKSLHQGIEQLDAEMEMNFFWNMNCDQPNLEEKKQYLIIGRDGIKFKTGYREEYRYPLMGTALVLRYYRRSQNYLQFNVLKLYQHLILARGCYH